MIFALDTLAPTDVLFSVFYAVPVFLALLSGSTRFLWTLAVVLGIASMVSYEARVRPELAVHLVEVNRALSGAEILLIAGLMYVLRRQRERADRTNRLLEAIVRQMPAGVVVADPSGAVMLANDRATELWRDAAATDHDVPQATPLARTLATGETVPGEELPVIRTDGKAAVLRVSAAPVRDADGETLAVVMTCNDVTDMKRAAEERQLLLARERVARADAEDANRAKDQFLAAVSHDLRSPLSAISAWAAVLRAKGREGPGARAVEKIDVNVRLLARLIDDLLDVSRITAGKLSLEMAPVSLPAVIESALDGVQASAEAKHLALHVDLDPSVAPVVGDPSRLQQVVANLLTNAVKFTPEHGAVTIRLEHAGDRERLTVEDTGCGIPADFLPHLFERFSQAPGAPRQGLGLGLAIVRHIVESHGGMVRGESAGEGRGARFTVELPVSVGDQLAAGAAHP